MMKITRPSNHLLVLMLIFFSLFATAQTSEHAKKITASYSITYLEELAVQTLERSTKERKEVVRYARAMNVPLSYTTKEGGYAALQRILPDGSLIYYKTNNKDAGISTRVSHLNSGGSTGYNLNGENMVAYVWDAGHPRVTHQEYDGLGGNDRVSIMDVLDEGDLKLNSHAAHVVGTIVASGVQPQAKGMAPQAKVKAYNWTMDLLEATTAAAQGMLLSNHSYGVEAVEVPDQWFGAYQTDARFWDNLMFNAPYYLMVNAAGNDGNDNISNEKPFAQGYDKLNGTSTSKNNLVVAAAHDASVDSNGNLIYVNIASFSSQGPTDDLRIKPDITGNGVGVYSTYDSSDTAYGTINGTSMSTPNVTGSLLLMQQHYNNINGKFMRAATLKGLALHTADDAGPIGPDAVWGWGLMNAKKTAETIALNGSSSSIQELVLSQGQTITLTVNSDDITDLRASISWTDRPGEVNEALNSQSAALVNDLDIRVNKGTATYYPWRLTSAVANSADGDNTKDPYERVDVVKASGTYTITISHKGTLVGGNQAFSLIVTGLQAECVNALVPQNIRSNGVTGTTAFVSCSIVPGVLYDLRYRKIGASSWIDDGSIIGNNHTIKGLVPATNYEFQMRSKCTGGLTSPYSLAVGFSTLSKLVYCNSGPQKADNNFYISNVKLNTIDNTSVASKYSDFTNLSTELVAGQIYTITAITTSNDSYKATYSIFIDFNQNERFDDPGELVSTISTSTNLEAIGTFKIPIGINPLTTTMRVSVTNDSTPAGPCDDFNFGEVEDYTINLTDTPLGLDDDHLLSGIRLFPNPVNDNNTFYIKVPKLNGEMVSISVNDMLGREVFNTQQTFTGTMIKVNFSPELKSGIYMVTISSNNEKTNFRIIKR